MYHSSCPQPGIAGIVTVVSSAYPGATQLDPASRLFDPKATPGPPRWFNVDVRMLRKTRLLPLQQLRQSPELATMRVRASGSRLSITPADPDEWRFIVDTLLEVEPDES